MNVRSLERSTPPERPGMGQGGQALAIGVGSRPGGCETARRARMPKKPTLAFPSGSASAIGSGSCDTHHIV